MQLTICCPILVLAGVVASADDAVFSGPQPGEELQPLHVVPAYGDEDDTVDLVEESDGNPTLLVFVQGANRPAARLTRVLLNYAEMRAEDELYAAMIWLDDDQSGAQQYLRQAISWWGMGPTVGISVDGPEGPGSYGLNRNVNVTVLVANENRVTANYALVQPSETDASRILADVVELIDGDVPNAAQVAFLSLPTRKPADAPWNTAPRDVRLRTLISDLLGAEDNADVDLAAPRVEEYLAGKPHLTEELARVAESLTRGRTNVGTIPATPVLQVWRERSRSRETRSNWERMGVPRRQGCSSSTARQSRIASWDSVIRTRPPLVEKERETKAANGRQPCTSRTSTHPTVERARRCARSAVSA